jgi:hypothetical protein
MIWHDPEISKQRNKVRCSFAKRKSDISTLCINNWDKKNTLILTKYSSVYFGNHDYNKMQMHCTSPITCWGKKNSWGFGFPTLYLTYTHIKTHKLLQVCKQAVTNLFTSCRQDVFALLVPSCWNKVWNKLLTTCKQGWYGIIRLVTRLF